MIRRLFAAFVALFVIVSSTSPALAAHFYVDRKLGNVADRAPLKSSGPVQLLVEFQTNGKRNEKATKQVTKMVLAELAKLPYLPQAAEKPVESGALLTVKINNVFNEEERKAAMKAAFKTGFTFGASDTVVRDNYTIDVGYVPATGATPLTSQVQHSLITTLGKPSDATIGDEYKKPTDALAVVFGQALDHGLDAIARKAAQ